MFHAPGSLCENEESIKSSSALNRRLRPCRKPPSSSRRRIGVTTKIIQMYLCPASKEMQSGARGIRRYLDDDLYLSRPCV